MNGTSNGDFSDTEPESEPEDDQPSGVVYPQVMIPDTFGIVPSQPLQEAFVERQLVEFVIASMVKQTQTDCPQLMNGVL